MTGSNIPIKIEDLKKEFLVGFAQNRVFHALQGISFEVKKGRTLGFLGPNGAGKTTAIKILTGLLHPTSGSVQIFGQHPQQPKTRAHFGYLPENPSFHDHLTGREVLNFLGELLSVEPRLLRQRIPTLLELVHLTDAADLQVRRYSKGMTQRLGIAQALLSDPELVILDEPMSGLDPIGRRDIKDLIRSLRVQGRTVFFSTHIISDVEEICDDVVILVGGHVVRAEREVVVLAVNVPESFGPTKSGGGDGVVSLSAPNHEEAKQLVERLWAAKARVLSMNTQKYGLEDVFMSEVAKRPLPRGRLED